MDVEQIKRRLLELSPNERSDVSAFLWHLEHASDPAYRKIVDERSRDKNPAHWLPLEEFIRRLGQESE